ncbi:MAG TPA: HU family DNA-binding protein [Phycisphaerae bacterium]|nr:HU family DNA-binding protein [Phycisphaerae bacterium]
MNLGDLKSGVAEAAGITKADAGKAVAAVFDTIAEALVQGEKITLAGFGTFSLTERGARTGRNPRTGEEVEIAAAKGVKFKAGKGLKDAVGG